MDWLVLEGVRPWDGRYEFDIAEQPFTTREWGWIKRFANYLPLNVDEGWRGGDPELFAAFAVIALHRAGRIQPSDAADIYERLADTPFGATLRLETDEPAEGDASPPAGNNGGSSSSSGEGSPTSSEMWAPPAGIPASDTLASSPVGSPT